MSTRPVILSIAGYDPSSGAGVTADIKTAAALGCYAVTCITAVTVQSTQGVVGVHPLKASLVSDTLKTIADDFQIAAIRIGMMGLGEIAEAVGDFLQAGRFSNVVLDPVLRSSSGSALIDPAGVQVIRQRLLPLCDVITPNVDEAAILANADPLGPDNTWDDASARLMEVAAGLHRLGSRAVVVTGGHLDPPNDLFSYVRDGLRQERVFPGTRIESGSTHGTGCAFATAIACELALGQDLPDAVASAKVYVRTAIEAAYPLGKGAGPMHHLFRLDR